MPKSTYLRNAFLDLMFNGDPIADLAENDTSSPLTEFWIALHTADPGVNNTQASSEASYTGYARVSVDRDTGGWIVAGNTATLQANVVFPDCTAGAQVITHWSIGVANAGATPYLWSGTVAPNIPVSPTLTAPELKAGTVVTEL